MKQDPSILEEWYRREIDTKGREFEALHRAWMERGEEIKRLQRELGEAGRKINELREKHHDDEPDDPFFCTCGKASCHVREILKEGKEE
jgi:hypothetical protein